MAMNGPGSKASKSDWYDAVMPEAAIVATRSKEVHRQRRKIWDQGFSIKALDSYEPRVARTVNVMEQKVSSSVGSSIDCSQLFRCFGFDVTSELAFAESLDMLKSDESHFAIDIIRTGFSLFGFLSAVPWLVRLAFTLPALANWWNKALFWAEKETIKRSKSEVAEPDVRCPTSLMLRPQI